ncbi:NUDIX domain-containing protein [Methylocapsa aurea]|uniref:NUDIX domain-containing protein n=1 Tax=Methylocapsa aurea TaxID=663610 RepID=UPI00192E664C|nr:NUDIX domain-containing protein [Methylocapsa aurea]
MMMHWFTRRRRESRETHRSARLGVRALVLDRQGRVFVVRHSRVPGCHLPGGAVEPGESAPMALARELEQRRRILLSSAPHLHGLFFDERTREHLACYVVRDFRQAQPYEADWATAKAGFFAADELPAAPSRATRARLDEVLHGASISMSW